MAEYIERKAAIKAVEKNDCEGYATWAIKSVPVADVVERKHGRYIIDDMGDASCSECGANWLDITQNYCPNCGATMEES